MRGRRPAAWSGWAREVAGEGDRGAELPSARAQHSTAPAPSPGRRAAGSPAGTPSTAGAEGRRRLSYRRSAVRSAPSTDTPGTASPRTSGRSPPRTVVNGSEPDQRVQRPTEEARTARAPANSATPPTTGGSTSGTVTSARSSDAAGQPGAGQHQASGTPSTTRHRGDVAVTSESRSASRTSGGRASRQPPRGPDQQAEGGQEEQQQRQQAGSPRPGRPPARLRRARVCGRIRPSSSTSCPARQHAADEPLAASAASDR